jgi:hypothetical protein
LSKGIVFVLFNLNMIVTVPVFLKINRNSCWLDILLLICFGVLKIIYKKLGFKTLLCLATSKSYNFEDLLFESSKVVILVQNDNSNYEFQILLQHQDVYRRTGV